MWGGIRLSDVLKYVGIDRQDLSHVCFASYATLCEDDEFYGASITLESALEENRDVLLAYEVSCFPFCMALDLIYNRR